MALKIGDRVVELDSDSTPAREGRIIKTANDRGWDKKSWAVINWDDDFNGPGFLLEGEDFLLIQPNKKEAPDHMLLKDVPPQKEGAITQYATSEQVIAFLEGCIGENISLEHTGNGSGGYGESHTLTFMAKLFSVSVQKRNSDGFYELYLYVEGRERLIINSKHPFILKKCFPSTGHIF